MEHVARQRSGVPASEGDLRDRADAETRLAVGFPFDDQTEIFVLLRRPERRGSRRSREHAVCGAPCSGCRCVGFLLRLGQRFGLHRPAGVGIAGHGFPRFRGEGCRNEPFGGEFRQQTFDLIDGVTRIGVGFGQFGVDLLRLFQSRGDDLSAHVGVLRRRGLHRQRRRFGRRGVIQIFHGEHQHREFRGFGERLEQLVLHLGRGVQFEGAAVELVFADARVGGCRHEFRVSGQRRVGPRGIPAGEVVQYIHHCGIFDRQQGREGGFAVIGSQQGVDRFFAGGLRQQGVIAGFRGGGGDPGHRFFVLGGGRFPGQRIFQAGLQGFHVGLLRLVQQVAQTFEIFR